MLYRHKSIPVKLFLALLTVDLFNIAMYKLAEIHTVDQSGSFYLNLFFTPFIWIGLACSLLHVWLWTRILATTELSLAHPVSSLSYPLAMLVAQFFFHEHLSLTVWCGAIFIYLGVAIVGLESKSPTLESEISAKQ